MEEYQGQKRKESMLLYLKRGVTCEIQVLREEIDNPMVIHILSDQGIDFFFDRVGGYY